MYTYTTSGGVRDYKGRSTDEKPKDGVPNGSSFYEMNTGDLYMYDEETREWLKQ